ncbi:hypothetical protein GTH32_18130 [Alteromonas sp. 345S023]|uniref:Uncharacterized protein n=1 Tax=Alteromonas profundi TaxID=2696062 RepID=A0A7X5RN11_9ALTE|nr:hypothetical protein [Alteromonas profundi]NDV93090.1 hypothetical protein [Alteromonas profundi]
MEELSCNWTPQLIVEVIKSIVWPVTVLLIGLKFRTVFFDSISNFFSTNTVSELSASTSGLSAKFVAAKQSIGSKKSSGASSVSLPENMSLESIAKRHEHNRTDFSEETFKAIKTHLSALALSPEEEVEILAKEASLLQSAIRYFDINKVLFRSQLNLFFSMKSNSGYASKDDIQSHFLEVKKSVENAYTDWDWIKYMSYPVSDGLLSDERDGYKLTTLGSSYVSFMSRNPQLVDELSPL